MTNRMMSNRLFLIVMVLLCALSAAYVVAQAPPYVVIQPPQGYLPPTIVIRAFTPPEVQVCAESVNGLAGCRTINEFRQWVTERPQFNQQQRK